jgi:hypothetical protein
MERVFDVDTVVFDVWDNQQKMPALPLTASGWARRGIIKGVRRRSFSMTCSGLILKKG